MRRPEIIKTRAELMALHDALYSSHNLETEHVVVILRPSIALRPTGSFVFFLSPSLPLFFFLLFFCCTRACFGRECALEIDIPKQQRPTELAHSFLFCSCVCFCLHGLFNSISFHKFFRQLSAFSLCFSGLISALLALLTVYLFMKVSLSPDIILCG